MKIVLNSTSGNKYFALVDLDLLPAEQLPAESLQILGSVLARLSVGSDDAGTQLI